MEVRLFKSQRTNDFRLSAIVDLPIVGKSRDGAFMPEVLRPRRVPVGFGADPERTSCKVNGGLDSPVPATEIALQQIPTEIATARLRRSDFMYAIRARSPRRSRRSSKHNMPW